MAMILETATMSKAMTMSNVTMWMMSTARATAKGKLTMTMMLTIKILKPVRTI